MFAGLRSTQQTQNICITFVQCVVGPALYKCKTNVLCLPGIAAGLAAITSRHRPNVLMSTSFVTICNRSRPFAIVCDHLQSLATLSHHLRRFCDYLRSLATICNRLRRFAIACNRLRQFATLCDRLRRFATICDFVLRLTILSFRHCHIIYLTIIRRFSWPSLAYMCTNLA